MDQFSRTVLPAAAESNIRSIVLAQHMPVFRRCVDHDDTVLLLSQCQRPELSMTSTYMLLLTRRRLLVTRQSRLSGRVRVHLDTALADLGDIVWRSNNHRQSALEFAATIGDLRHRFLVDRSRSRQLGRTDARVDRMFSPTPVAI